MVKPITSVYVYTDSPINKNKNVYIKKTQKIGGKTRASKSRTANKNFLRLHAENEHAALKKTTNKES